MHAQRKTKGSLQIYIYKFLFQKIKIFFNAHKNLLINLSKLFTVRQTNKNKTVLKALQLALSVTKFFIKA